MARDSKFTEEEISILKENPYTLKVAENRFSLTLEAKKKILELSNTGLTYRQIVEQLGYDSRILGTDRTKNIVRGVLRDVEAGRILHEGYLRTAGTRMSEEGLEKLDCNPASYNKLKNEVIYLRREVEFLKKISQQVISGKRGK